MKYVGSKARIFPKFSNIVLEHINTASYYLEPFVGGCNSMQYVPNTVPRSGIDSNKYIIALFTALQNGYEPPGDVTLEEYRYWRTQYQKDTMENMPTIGFVGVGCSYAGKWFGGYARGDGRNFASESKKALLKKLPRISDVTFIHGDYHNPLSQLPLGKGIIYCDPPYKGVTGYGGNKFDHAAYYDWVRKIHSMGHYVYCSELTMPSDFTCVWEAPLTVTLRKDNYGKNIERLWVLK
jgi:DNA adenine methylase